MQPARQLAQLAERRVQVLDAASERCRGGRLGRSRDEPQRQRKGDKTLLGAIVEIALDPAASVIGGLDDARARLLEHTARAAGSAPARVAPAPKSTLAGLAEAVIVVPPVGAREFGGS